MQRSLSDIVGIKNKLIEILNEPTLNKVCDSVCTLLFIAMIINIFTVQDWEFVLNVLAVTLAIGAFGWVYKKFNLPLQVQDDERKKNNIEFDHMIKNPKLEETEIRLDKLDELHNDMNHLRVHFEQLTNTLGDKIIHVEKNLNNLVNGESLVVTKEELESKLEPEPEPTVISSTEGTIQLPTEEEE